MAYGAALLLIALLVAGVLWCATWARDRIRSQDQRQAASDVQTVYENPTTCADGDLEVSMSAPDTLGVGQPLSISATVKNKSSHPCLVDAGSSSLTAVVTSGQATLWRSTECVVLPTARPLLIDAGETTSTTIAWDGKVGRTACPDPSASPGPGAAPSPSPAAPATDAVSAAPSATADPAQGTVSGAGSYHVRLEMGGRAVTEDRLFVIE